MSCNVRTRRTMGSYLKDIIRRVHWCQKRAVLCRFRATKYTNTICHANFFLKAFTKNASSSFLEVTVLKFNFAYKQKFLWRQTHSKSLHSTYLEIQEAGRRIQDVTNHALQTAELVLIPILQALTFLKGLKYPSKRSFHKLDISFHLRSYNR